MRDARWRVAALSVAALCACAGRSSLQELHRAAADAGAIHDGSARDSGSSSGGDDSSTTGDDSSGGSSGSAGCPPVHGRPTDTGCLQPPPRLGNCGFAGTPQPGHCFVDSDCAGAGLNARCIRDGHGPASCVCTFDACIYDSACPAGQICACREDKYMFGRGNTCVPSNCRVDSDCGPGSWCSPTLASGCGGIGGYYCHTPSDECTTDCECTMSDPSLYCAYDTTRGRWSCQPLPACQ
jgi:hypothetical protein